MLISERQSVLRAYHRVAAPLLHKYELPPLASDPNLSDVKACHLRLLRKVHPGKGGQAEEFRAVQAARKALDIGLLEASHAPSPPPATPCKRPAASPHVQRKPAAATVHVPPATVSHVNSDMQQFIENQILDA